MRRFLVVLLAALFLGGPASSWARTGGGTGPEPGSTVEPDPGPTEPPGPGGRADVAVSYGGPTEVLVGDRPAFTFTVINNGPDPAESVSLSASVPPGLEDVAVVPSDPAVTCTWNPNAYGPGAPPEADAPSTRGEGGYADCPLGTMSPGTSVAVALEATRTRARELYLDAWAGGATGDENYDNNYVNTFLDADRSHPADLGLSMEAPKSPKVGDEFVISMKGVNNGPSPATDVVVRQDMPAGLDFVSASAGCTFEEGDGGPPPGPTDRPEFWNPRTVTCAIDGIPAGSGHTSEIVVQRVSGWEMWSSAWVEASNYDENYENDYSYVLIAADPSVTSDLSVTSEEPAGEVLVGEEFDLAFSLRNHGPAASGDVWFYDYLPTGLEFVSTNNDACHFDDYSIKDPAPYPGEPGAPGPEGGGGIAPPIYYGGGFIVCGFGLLDNAGVADFSVRLRRTSAYEIWNYASVGASNFDASYENNHSELRLAPDRSVVADLSVAMSAPSNPALGETFNFDVSVTNDGPSVARDVVLYDYVPEGLDFVSAAPEACTFSDYADGTAPPPGESGSYSGYRELRCDLGALDPGATVPVTLTATRTFEWEIWNGAWVTTSSYDPDWENDYAYAVIEGENPYDDCDDATGGEENDAIVTDGCPVDTGPGADDVSIEAGSGAGPREIRTGPGADDIRVSLRTPSPHRRRIHVWSGGGADVITVSVAPGSGDARVVVHSSGGNDRVYLDVAPRVRRLEIVVRTGEGDDYVSSVRYSARTRGRGWLVKGGSGADTILGGSAADLLFGGPGRDALDAGPGNDLLDGGRGRDVCLGGAGRDETRSC